MPYSDKNSNAPAANGNPFVKGLITGSLAVTVLALIIWVISSRPESQKVSINEAEIYQDSILTISLSNPAASNNLRVLFNTKAASNIQVRQNALIVHVPEVGSINPQRNSVVVTVEDNGKVLSKLTLPFVAKPVIPTPPNAIVNRVDLLKEAQAAKWYSGILQPDGVSESNVAALVWPGDINDSNGFARTDSVTLEDNTIQNVLRTHPRWVDNGSVYGIYDIKGFSGVKSFTSTVGFVKDLQTSTVSTDGVTFEAWVHFQANGASQVRKIMGVHKNNDGQLQLVSARLPADVPEAFSLELRVNAGSQSVTDWAAWLNPRIIRLFKPIANLPIHNIEFKYRPGAGIVYFRRDHQRHGGEIGVISAPAVHSGSPYQ